MSRLGRRWENGASVLLEMRCLDRFGEEGLDAAAEGRLVLLGLAEVVNLVEGRGG